jgi:enamidase
MRNTGWTVDLVRFGNPKALDQICEMIAELGAHRRVVLGTDSPTGNGVEPLGMLHLITHLSSLTKIKPEEALCMATGNTARVYNLPVGFIEPGRSADVALVDAPIGSVASSALESFAIGDSPAVGMVMIDGLLVVKRSKNTIPPQRNYKLSTH